MIDGNILMSVGLDKVYIEIFTINQRHLALSLTVIFRFVFGIHFIIDGILGLLCMEFAGISLGVTAVEVVYAIGDIAGLLNLGKKIACADSVDTSCGKEEEVAVVGIMTGYHIHDFLFSDKACIVVGGNLLRKSCIYFSAGLGIHDIPHFGLSE